MWGLLAGQGRMCEDRSDPCGLGVFLPRKRLKWPRGLVGEASKGPQRNRLPFGAGA